MQDLNKLSAAQLARHFAAGELSPTVAVDHCFDAIKSQPDNPVFLRITEQRARQEAAAAEARYRAGCPLGPLDGVPIAWKALFDLAGEPTSAGSQVYWNAPPATADALVVKRLRAAGMVCLGATNMTEFAYSGLGLNPHYGTPRNPFDPARIPGGSSSGSGVAVAAGMAFCAMGSDTGGSIRIPASFNGLVGYKPSAGRHDKTGVFDLSPTLDTIGPLARSVEDCVLLDMLMRGQVKQSIRPRPLDSLRLVVPTNVVHDDIEAAVADNFAASLARLESAGVVVKHCEIPMLNTVLALTPKYGTITAPEAWFIHRELLESEQAEQVDPRVISRIVAGRDTSAYDYLALLHAQKTLIAEISAQLGDALLAMPTTVHTAPLLAPLEADDDCYYPTNLLTLRNTMLGNFLDTPGLALPNGLDEKGLPTSILLSAASGQDDKLLGFGLALETAGLLTSSGKQ